VKISVKKINKIFLKDKVLAEHVYNIFPKDSTIK